MSLEGWVNLVCMDCKSRDFLQIVELVFKDGQGSSPKPKGYKCAKCGLLTDQGALIQVARNDAAKRKIAELQAEMG